MNFFFLITINCSAQVISFTTNEDGNIVVKGKLNDTVANLIFDTGGGLNIVSEKFFQKIKEKASFKCYYTGFRHDGDRIDVAVYKIPLLLIGGYKIYNALVGVTNLLDEWNMDGIISLNNFRNQAITIDYKKKQLRLESNASLKKIAASADSLPIKIHEYTDISLDIFVPVCIGTTVLDMEFDTGSSPGDVIINSKYLSALHIDTTATINNTIYTPFTQQPYRHYIANLEHMEFCGISAAPIRKVRVDFKQNMIHDGIIGAGYFHNTPFTIDIANGRILVITTK